MSASFIKIPSELIFNPAISPLELRVLANILFWSGINLQRYGDPEVKYGAEKLGAKIGIGREACRRALYKLQNLNLISLKRRGNLVNESYGLASAIIPTIDAGLKQLRDGGREAANLLLNDAGNLHLNDVGQTDDLHLKDVGDLHQKKPTLPLNDAGVHLNDVGHIDDRFKIKLNLNKISCADECAQAPTHAREHNAPADGAAGQSMPIQESAEEVRAEAPAANIDAAALWREYCTNQQDLAKDLEFVVYEGRYYLRRRCKYELAAHVRTVSSLAFFRSKGVYIQGILDQDFHYKNETIIKEVA